eukprot:SAG25_NODE_101_length_15508_cov_11.653384_11_plen_94_part_00
MSARRPLISAPPAPPRPSETLRRTARHWPPAVNQVELHPYHPQRELRAYCKRHGILVQAYASLGGQDAVGACASRAKPPAAATTSRCSLPAAL